MKARLALLIVLGTIGQASADAPKTSIRPMPRPVLAQPVAGAPAVAPLAVASTLPALARIRPLRRPDVVATAAPELTPTAAPETRRKGLLGLIAPRAKPAKRAKASSKGAVCGDPSIKGKVLARITSKTKGCGIEDPVSVTSVDGVTLTPAATIDCTTAKALKTWVQKGLRPALGASEPARLRVAASYTCRSRNNVRGAKISEHGRGKAIDIASVVLANGKDLTVRQNFRTLRKAYKAACGIFGTTLGPGSDGYHEDHMHFDTARQRSGGAYCR